MTTEAMYQIEPRIERQGGLLLAGISERYTLDRRVEIPRQWTRFAPQIAAAPNILSERIGGETYGAISFSGGGFEYLAAVRVWDASDLPEGWSAVRVAPSRIAAFAHTGAVATLPTTLDAIHLWQPRAGVAVGGPPQLLEVYGADFDLRTGQGSIEVRLALAG